jgi:competence protein ComEC
VAVLLLAGAGYLLAGGPESAGFRGDAGGSSAGGFGRGGSGPVAGARSGSPEDAPLDWRSGLRRGISDRIDTAFTTESGLVQALLLAERGELDPAVRADFTRAGAAHLLAISGFHVGVLAGWVLLLLRRAGLSRGGATAVAAGVVWGYVALLGFPTSASRAGLILTAAAAGRLRGRPVHPLGGWGAALLAVVLLDPSAATSAGAQLSFAGALGLIVWATPWTEALLGGWARLTGRSTRQLTGAERAVVGAVAVSLAAQAATLPLAAWHFQRVSLMALPATLLATPLVSFALPGALLSLAAESLSLPGTGVLASGVETLLWAARVSLRTLAALDPGWLAAPATVGLATAAAVGVRRGLRDGVSAMALGVGVAIIWSPILGRPLGHDGLEVRLLDVGQGDAIAVGSPSGRWILVDTGAGSGERLARRLVRGGIPSLDALLITHPDLDHMGAAAGLVSTLPVASLGGSGSVRGTDAFRALVERADEKGLPWRRLGAGDRWRWDGVEIRVLHPPSEAPGGLEVNDRSLVLHLRWGELDVLLTGDISVEVEEALAEGLPRVEILKVAHHGSRTSSGDVFLDTTRPGLAAVSVGRSNRFGHPSPSVVKRFMERGIPVVRTDRSGTLRILGDADGSWRVLDGSGREIHTSPPSD